MKQSNRRQKTIWQLKSGRYSGKAGINYGTRKIKVELAKKGYTVSRRRIGRIMKQEGLVSSYAVAQYKPHVDKCNESKVQNIVNREFSDQPQYNVVVSDLTYVRAGNSWNYICVLVDLFNREIFIQTVETSLKTEFWMKRWKPSVFVVP